MGTSNTERRCTRLDPVPEEVTLFTYRGIAVAHVVTFLFGSLCITAVTLGTPALLYAAALGVQWAVGVLGWVPVAAAAAVLAAVGWYLRPMLMFAWCLFNFMYWLPMWRSMDLPVRLLRKHAAIPHNAGSTCWPHDVSLFFSIKYTAVLTRSEYDAGSVPRLLRPKEHDAPRCLLLFSHRSWADFFIARYLAQGHGACLSRNIIKWVFIPFYFATLCDHSLWFFDNNKPHRKRGMSDEDFKEFCRRSREALYCWIDDNFNRTFLDSLVVFPEGTRNLADVPRPLRRGMVYYAYTRSIPVQVIITKGNEEVLSETQLFGGSAGTRVLFRYGSIVDPRNYETREDFFDEVEERFKAEFAFLYEEQQEEERCYVDVPFCTFDCCSDEVGVYAPHNVSKKMKHD
eukprot:TRINITY_DN2931_c3_g1_i1.p1 TRINITY_DN2931_c3_g1~~TRINITY_DN2931_c3_g1_i1.p1  ORF type:complete len:427 (-),score=157.80 TRINITY_DN2931_c3_g1_i1:157-1356(-)